MKFTTLSIVALMAATSAANAASFSSPSATFTGDVIDFNAFDGYLLPQGGSNSLSLDYGVTLTTDGPATVGQNAFDLNDNGLWSVVGNTNRDGTFLSAEFNNANDSINFSFASGMQKVGIFINQYQDIGENNSLNFFAYDINGNVLDTRTINVDTAWDSYDEGMFVGFERASADVYRFGVSGGTFVMDNLTISAVPEPETVAMLLAGLGLLSFAARRRA